MGKKNVLAEAVGRERLSSWVADSKRSVRHLVS